MNEWASLLTCIVPHSQPNVEKYSYHTRLLPWQADLSLFISFFLQLAVSSGVSWGQTCSQLVGRSIRSQKCLFWICSLGDLLLVIMVEKTSPFDRNYLMVENNYLVYLITKKYCHQIPYHNYLVGFCWWALFNHRRFTLKTPEV